MWWGQVGPVASPQRPDAARHLSSPVRFAGLKRHVERRAKQGFEEVFGACAAQTVAVDRVGIGRGDIGARAKVVGMNVAQQIRSVAHHLRRPERGRRVPGAAQQFLPQATIEQGDLRHVRRLSFRRSRDGMLVAQVTARLFMDRDMGRCAGIGKVIAQHYLRDRADNAAQPDLAKWQRTQVPTQPLPMMTVRAVSGRLDVARSVNRGQDGGRARRIRARRLC